MSGKLSPEVARMGAIFSNVLLFLYGPACGCLWHDWPRTSRAGSRLDLAYHGKAAAAI